MCLLGGSLSATYLDIKDSGGIQNFHLCYLCKIITVFLWIVSHNVALCLIDSKMRFNSSFLMLTFL